jgi:TPR repeat protein
MTAASKLLLTVSFLSFTLSSPLLATQGTEDLPKSKKRKREDDLSTSFTEPQNKKLTLEQKPTLATLRETIKTAKGKALEEAQEQLIDLLFDSGNPSIKPEDYATLSLHMEKRNPKALCVRMASSTDPSLLKYPQLTQEETQNLKEYLEKILENKSEEALRNYYLGFLYQGGISGGKPNPELAIEWLTKAWDKGLARAAHFFGVIYEVGLLTQKINAELAIAWHTKAWDKGYAGAASALGSLYLRGIPGQLEPNAELAMEWYTKGWDKGDEYAAIGLGLLYKNGIPGQVEPNAQRAIEWFTKAWDNGVIHAADNIGALYHQGIPGQLEPNAQLAITWLTKAWDNGFVFSAPSLAKLYREGISGQLTPNHELSLKYFLLTHRLSTLGPTWCFSHYLDIPAYISEITKDDSLEIEQDINTFKDHLQQARGLIDPEIMMNDPHATASHFKDSLPISELLAPYKAIAAYQAKVLALLETLENPGLLVTWPKIKIENDQEAIPNTDTQGTFLRRFTVNGQKYLTFGEDNVPLSLELVALLKGEDESLVQAKEAIGFLRPLIQKISGPSMAIIAEPQELSKVTHLIARIKEQQALSFSGSDIEKDPIIRQQTLAEHNHNLLAVLESVEKLQENLKLVFEQTTPLRNKRFIHYYKFPVVEENEKLKS